MPSDKASPVLEILYGHSALLRGRGVYRCRARSIGSVGVAQSSRTTRRESGYMTCISPGAGNRAVAINKRRDENIRVRDEETATDTRPRCHSEVLVHSKFRIPKTEGWAAGNSRISSKAISGAYGRFQLSSISRMFTASLLQALTPLTGRGAGK